MRGKEAIKKCPELQLVQVPVTHGKAELGPYRAAGKQVCIATSFSLPCCQTPLQVLAQMGGYPALWQLSGQAALYSSIAARPASDHYICKAAQLLEVASF